MLGSLLHDDAERKRCNDSRYGMKFKSYKLGYAAGKHDRLNLKRDDAKTEQNPYKLTPDILDLLRRRARWESGYFAGWQRIQLKKQNKAKKKKK